MPITQTSNSLESMFVEVWRKNYTSQKYIIGNIYRLPLYDSDNLTSFTNEYIDILNTLRNRSKFVYLCGDFNIDLLKLNSNNNYNMLFDNVISSGFVPKITLPTRICDTSSTLIDNVYTNTIDKKHTSGILIRPISDHQMYFCILNENYTKANNAHRYIEVEICNEYSIDQFRNEIANANIYDKLDLSPSANPNKNYELLAEQLQIAKSTHMPKKIKRFNKRKHKKEKWMNNELLTQIVRKNKMYVEWKTTPVTNVNYELIKLRFKSYEKDVRFAIQEAKKSYFNRIFDTYKSDIKKTWLTINDTLSRNKNKQDLPSTFHYNGLTLTNPKEIANSFNVYFAGIGDKLASEIKTPTNHNANFTSYLENPTMNRLQFRHIAEEDTMKAIDNLENKNSSGHDGISNKLLKSIRYELCKPLTLIINQMLSSGVFPETFKKSKIIPLYKKGDSSLLSNYRPISLLPTISKVFERIIYNQLYQYFNDNELLAEQQYGFRAQHSTEYAAIKLFDHISKEMDSGNTPTALYIDLSKAFDTLSFDIILQKLKHYGVMGTELRLLTDYLTNRKQYVVFNNHCSDITDIVNGVPQGSILGPLLFRIHINDLIRTSNKCKFIMYADDTTIYFNLEDFDPDNVSNEINNELEKITKWLQINKLSLNTQKTKLMIFHRKQKHIKELNIVINGTKIDRVESFNFLGLTIDETLSWAQHVDIVKKKVSKVIGIFYRLKNIFSMETMMILYKSLIASYLNYGLLLWGTESDKVLTLQKKAIRLISNSSYISHTNPLFIQHKLLKIGDLFKLKLLKLYYKLSYNLLPSYFDKYREIIEHEPARILRINYIHPPLIRRVYAECSPLLQLIKLINDLRNDESDTILQQIEMRNNSYRTFSYNVSRLYLNTYDPVCPIGIKT